MSAANCRRSIGSTIGTLAKPGMMDKIKVAFSFGVVPKKAIVLEPNPELIDLL